MSGRCVFFLTSAGFEAAWQATSTALTAAAMGDEVLFVASFDALRALAAGTFGEPTSEVERVTAARATTVNAATPMAMLREARSLGARILACDTTVRLCGLDSAALEQGGAVDEVMGLPSIWRLTQGAARVLSF